MYLHGYGLGFPGNVEANANGPAAGLIGFGVMAAFYSSGIDYATPSQFPLQNTIGVYDPTPLPGAYEATRYPRVGGGSTFDMIMRSVKLHPSRTVSPVRLLSGSDEGLLAGVGYGGRAELGHLHIGAAG